VESQYLTACVLQNHEIGVTRAKYRFGRVFHGEVVVGRHQRLEAGLVGNQYSALMGLFAARSFYQRINCGLGAEGGNQILAHVCAHFCLDKREDRSGQEKHNGNRRGEKLGPEMSKEARRHFSKD
jgi:hypothetical protein